MKTLCIIQARMGSTRLRGKIMMEIKGKPLLGYVLNRVAKSKKIDKVVLATTLNKEDDKTADFCKKVGVECFRGSMDDVLDRYYQVSQNNPYYETIVRVTGDCPIIDPKLIDETIDFFEKGLYDYASNCLTETYPDGMDVEVFTKEALNEAWHNAELKSERAHVTPYIRNTERFKKGSLESKIDYSKYRFSVDNPEDFEVVKFILENTDEMYGYVDYVNFMNNHPEILSKNAHIKRNEGYAKSLKEDQKR